MNTPTIRYYANMVNSTQTGRTTPKYTIMGQGGYYPPIEQLRGRDGSISFNLMPQSREDKSSAPPMRLRAKNSLSFTGLKDFWVGGKLSGYAYGYPMDKPTYSSQSKPNPFFDYKDDGFLFIFHYDEQDHTNLTPISIELIVLENAKVLISAYCKMLTMGGFDEVLGQLRKQANVL